MPQSMNWNQLVCHNRHGSPSTVAPQRSPFAQDIDRITFSSHFRRLGRKTQVHPLNENDHIHSRLTHSLETSCVGRSLGQSVGYGLMENYPQTVREFGDNRNLLPVWLGEIVQAACLAHDLGNPPFGHCGEAAVQKWFEANSERFSSIGDCYHDFTRFDGNAMTFRILTRTGFDDYDAGIRPTYAVLGATLKYPYSSSSASDQKKKFNAFSAELATLEDTAKATGLVELGETHYCRHPLAYLTEAADDICYRIIDLEDATELGILPPDYMLETFRDILHLDAKRYADYTKMPSRSRNSMLRAKLIGAATNEAVNAFFENHEAIMNGQAVDALVEVGSGPVAPFIHQTYDTVSKGIFLSKRKVELELGANRSIATLLDTFCKDVETLCTDSQTIHNRQVETILGKDRVASVDPSNENHVYETLVMILDYITGMTDHYATQLCRKLLGIGV